MNMQVKAIRSQNIVLVYDSLDLQAIDRNKLKALLADKVPVVMDTPEMVVVVYQPEPTIIELGDRRIRVTLAQPADELGRVPIWKVAAGCSQLVPEEKSSLLAYGFNYDLTIGIEDRNTYKVINDKFVPTLTSIQAALQGELTSFIPRLLYQRGTTRYDMVLEPIDEQHLNVHLNAHFESGTTPSQDQLEASFYDEYRKLVEILPRLLEGDG